MDDNSLKKIISKEGKEFFLDVKSLELSKFLKDFNNDFPDKDIPLNEVDSKTLEKIIEYLKHYTGDEKPKEIPKPLSSGDLKPILSEFDYKFISSVSLQDCVELVNAANYLDIPGLCDLICARLASEMLNCEVEEARTKFGIECDMTPEEVEEYEKYPLD